MFGGFGFAQGYFGQASAQGDVVIILPNEAEARCFFAVDSVERVFAVGSVEREFDVESVEREFVVPPC